MMTIKPSLVLGLISLMKRLNLISDENGIAQSTGVLVCLSMY